MRALLGGDLVFVRLSLSSYGGEVAGYGLLGGCVCKFVASVLRVARKYAFEHPVADMIADMLYSGASTQLPVSGEVADGFPIHVGARQAVRRRMRCLLWRAMGSLCRAGHHPIWTVRRTPSSSAS